jgi:hypothetical protein
MKKIITILLVLLIAVSSVFACDCKDCKAKAKDAFIQEMKANIPNGFILVSVRSYIGYSDYLDKSYPLAININNISKISPEEENGQICAGITLLEDLNDYIVTHESYVEVMQMIVKAQEKAGQ